VTKGIKEKFQVEINGDGFMITQATEDVLTGRSLLDVYNEITRKRDMTQAQIDMLPKQKEMMEKDIEQFNKRLASIQPFISGIVEQLKAAEKAAQVEAARLKAIEEDPDKRFQCPDCDMRIEPGQQPKECECGRTFTKKDFEGMKVAAEKVKAA
jgi:hypothetical protein